MSIFFNFQDQVQMDIIITKNELLLPVEQVFTMGIRENPKRSFLFINYLLGKHLAASPWVVKIAGYLLANQWTYHREGRYFSDVSLLGQALREPQSIASIIPLLQRHYTPLKSILFVGFAETATGLAQAVFSAFRKSAYIHTTRELFEHRQAVLSFEETHSHATKHRFYLGDRQLIEMAKEIVLIDDELTTGNTALHFIEAVNRLFPGKEYTILSLLDWRGEEEKKKMQTWGKEHGIQIHVLSLLSGVIHLKKDEPSLTPFISDEVNNAEALYHRVSMPFSLRVAVLQHREYKTIPLCTGVFGMSSFLQDLVERECRQIGHDLSLMRQAPRTLCVGTGEFIYLPSQIAAYMGDGVVYQSSTRSPIYANSIEGYPVQSKLQYFSPDGNPFYLYNLQETNCHEIFILLDRQWDEPSERKFAAMLQRYGMEHITFIYL